VTTLDLFADPPPRPAPPRAGAGHWFTLPPHRPFLTDVAKGLYRTLSPLGPEGLAQAVVLTPTRRTARMLAEAFVEAAGGQAVLLPQIRTLGDLDEGEAPFEPGDLAADLPPAVTPLRRRFELARIVAEDAAGQGRSLDAVAALHLADALAAFLDATHIEEASVDTAALEALAPLELAGHWAVSTRFLTLALDAWPKRLEALGLLDESARRVQLLRALAARWRDDPPDQVLLAAGVQGGTPAEADLLMAVAAAPRGAVILPGLDLDLADHAWRAVGDAHPQAAMKRLLERAGLSRADVATWPVTGETAAQAAAGRSRRRMINEALRPAETTDDWLSVIAGLRAEGLAEGVDPVAEGLQGLTLLSAPDEDAAAAQAALLLREALETPGRTAALVTPDPALARRVSARLTRWGITVDSSAGSPLDLQPAGVMLSLLGALITDPTDPGALLGVAKHPAARLGRPLVELDRARLRLEQKGLRGPRPASWSALFDRLAEEPQALALALALHAAVEHARAPFAETGEANAVTAVRALAEAAERACADEKGAPGELWGGPGGEAAAALVANMIAAAEGLPPVTAQAFADIAGDLLRRTVVRPGAHAHPRLRVLGLIEARLVRADRVVLAGLEEGVWPRPAPLDPLLSRPMRRALGLPSPERRLGAAAHDFAQAACAPEVVLIAAERRGGQPATRSRWLWRLEMLARGAGLALPSRPIPAWAEALEAPLSEREAPPGLKLAPRPAPAPPVPLRPRALAATRVEEWIRDPYATYARYVLRLRKLDRPDLPLEARARGSAVHAAFQAFAEAHPEPPWGSADEFEALLLAELVKAGLDGPGLARERPLARRLGAWAAAFEAERRPGADLLIEREGRLSFPAPAGDFTLTAKADRLEVRADRIDVIDFKSGGLSSEKEVRSGLAPQLTLTAAIAAAGGFEGAPARPPGELIYARVTGRREAGTLAQRMKGEEAQGAQAALEGLKRRVAAFDHRDTAYVAKAAPKFIREDGSGDYDHLERLWEWRVVGDDAEDGGGDGAEGGDAA
jgi:ATP-dependent helicase/nuclease subunit B